MKNTLFLLACLFFSAASLGTASDTITLDEYLNLLQENHPFFTKEDLSVDIEKWRSQSSLGERDWSLSVTPAYQYAGEATASDFGGQTEAQSAQIELDLNKSLWSTGGRFGFSVSSGYLKYDPLFGPPEVYRSGISFSYTQPLLQNIGGRLDRLGYDVSLFGVDLAAVQSMENQEGFLLSKALEFMDWVSAAESVRIAEERLRLAREQLDQVNRRFRSNLVDRVDVLRAEDAVRIAEQSLLQLQSLYRAQQAKLAVSSYSDEMYEMTPDYDIYALRDLPDRKSAMKTLSSRSRLLHTFSIMEDRLLRNLAGLREQKRARLDLNVEAGLFGQDPQFGSSLEITEPDASVSLVYSQILGNRTVKADIERVGVEIEQMQDEMASAENDMQGQLAALLIQLDELENILALNRAQIGSAEEKTEEERRLYSQGRSELTFVIQSEDNEQNARLTYAQNAVLYHTLILQYRALMDELLAAP
jgi:outer membrane protein TolC